MRLLWRHFYAEAAALVFVIDTLAAVVGMTAADASAADAMPVSAVPETAAQSTPADAESPDDSTHAHSSQEAPSSSCQEGAGTVAAAPPEAALAGPAAGDASASCTVEVNLSMQATEQQAQELEQPQETGQQQKRQCNPTAAAVLLDVLSHPDLKVRVHGWQAPRVRHGTGVEEAAPARTEQATSMRAVAWCFAVKSLLQCCDRSVALPNHTYQHYTSTL